MIFEIEHLPAMALLRLGRYHPVQAMEIEKVIKILGKTF